MAEALIAKGHSVTWWTADWSHALKRQRILDFHAWRKEKGKEVLHPRLAESSLDNGFSKEATEGLRINLVPVLKYDKNISLQRVLSHRSYARGIAEQGHSHAARYGNPDVIIFSVPPMETGIVAFKLARIFNAKVCLDVMDAWPRALRFAFTGSKRGVLLRAFSSILLYPYKRMMQNYCVKADVISAQSKAFANYAQSLGARNEPAVFYLGGVRHLEKPKEESEELRETQQEVMPGKPYATANSRNSRPTEPLTSRPLNLIYLGSMGKLYDLETVVLGVIRLLDEGFSIRLDLLGDGEQRKLLEPVVAKTPWGKCVRFCGFLKGDRLAAALGRADLGIVPMHPESSVAVPYKLFDYLSASLPVINSLPGELQDQLDIFKCGRFYNAGNVDSYIDAIKFWLERPNSLEVAKVSALALFEQCFEAQKIYPAMADFLLALGKASPASKFNK